MRLARTSIATATIVGGFLNRLRSVTRVRRSDGGMLARVDSTEQYQATRGASPSGAIAGQSSIRFTNDYEVVDLRPTARHHRLTARIGERTKTMMSPDIAPRSESRGSCVSGPKYASKTQELSTATLLESNDRNVRLEPDK